MPVNAYLTALASNLVLNRQEQDSIDTSIAVLDNRIANYFKSDVSGHLKFGSSTRGTILPRRADERSDIDYMIIFNTSDGVYKPQTYLTRLRTFAARCYSTSEIHQSSPTVVLELSHIKFDLVPSIRNSLGQFQIPSSSNIAYSDDWMVTDPKGFNGLLTDANTRYNSLLKPLVRLVKYWNALNGRHFGSFDLENYIVGHWFSNCTSLKDLFYEFWNIPWCGTSTPQYIRDKVQSARDQVSLVRYLEQRLQEDRAEEQLERFIRDFS
jgi:hypothetical protein